ncbi:hypothetical protein JKF63_03408 [Porcisia hertigi]|uniref:PH domain-containing protein n=1 Tax=Porcisia hertigi TaxID=2761500 RepID=A0A836LHA3_9TRYP|nr:hypothetical protein JKF63_03408 [Porcisia hertigi]
MDSVHEAHLSRILKARRRRGVLGAFCEPVPAPSSRDYANGVILQSLLTPPLQRRGSSAGTQTAATVSTGRAATAAPPLTSPSSNLTLDGGVCFQSPGRVPSLAYSTPNSASRRRTRLGRSPVSASSPSGWLSGAQGSAHFIAPLPSPLYVRLPRSLPRGPLGSQSLANTAPWGRRGRFSHSSPFVAAPTGMNSRRSRITPMMRPLHTAWSQEHKSCFSRWGDESATTPLMASLSHKTNGGRDDQHPSCLRRSRHHRRHGPQLYDDDDDNNDGESVSFSSERRRDSEHQKTSPRDTTRQRRGHSRRHREAVRSEGSAGSRKWRPGQRGRSQARHHGGAYAPPAVYMGPATLASSPSPSSREGRAQRYRSTSAELSQHSSRQPQRHVQTERKFTVGLPDTRSTIDLRTSLETLRSGDWFYKWTAKGDVVHRRWVWVDTKSYLLLWSSYETLRPHFHHRLPLDHIYRVTPRDLSGVGEDGFPKRYYVLSIETAKRVLLLATELRDKFNAWFEALNNVMVFLHYNGTTKDGLIPG